MKKKTVHVVFAVIFLAVVGLAEAQQPGKIFRIGFLDSSTSAGMAVLVNAFRQELSKLGWIEGQNLSIDYRFGESLGADRVRELAAELVRLKVVLIVATAGPTVLAAKAATSAIPIVMTNPADPVGEGLVASLARPGGNVTGLSSLAVELNTKRLEVLKDAVPKLTRVGIPRFTSSAAAVSDELQMKAVRAAAVALKLKLEEITTKLDSKALESSFHILKQKQVGAILPVSRPLFGERKRFVELAVKYRLPAIYGQKGYMDEGGLMYYGVDPTDNYRRAAGYVDKILKGTKPAELPVQQATKFEFIISLKTAKQIGITLPPELLARANQVIK